MNPKTTNKMEIRVANTELGAAVYVGDNIEAAVEYAKNEGINGLVVAQGGGYPFTDVDFLQACPFVETLVVQRYGAMDLKGIHHLGNLKKLALNITADDRQLIDFSCFPGLEHVMFDWRPNAKSIFNCKSLKYLRINRFKKPDLTDFEALQRLEVLKIASSPIKTTKGVEKLNLRELGLYYLTKLESLEGLGGLAPTLKDMELQTCKRIMDIAEIGKLVNLEKLGVNNCGDIDSIKPIRELKKLKDFRFWESTNVIDGDMAPCIGVNTVAFKSRPHYTYTRQQIDEINSK